MKKIALKIGLAAIAPTVLSLLIIGAVVTAATQQQVVLNGKKEKTEAEATYGMDAVGFVEAARAEIGTNGGSKYRTWYTGKDDGEPWDAAFVSYCANKAGLLDIVIPKFQNCTVGAKWFEERGLLQYPDEYTPKLGDLVFFEYNNGDGGELDHVGIVTEAVDGFLSVIEGNTGNGVKENYHQMDAATIYAYATPVYPVQGGGTLPGGNNCEKVFRGLVERGYTEQAAAGVVGNLMWESGGGPDDIALNAVEGNGEGVGMVQWSFDRKTAFIQYCVDMKVGWPNENLEVQFNYLMWELEYGGQWLWSRYGEQYGADCNITLAEFKQCEDIELATRAFCAKFERCSYYLSGLPTRITYANNVYRSYAEQE